MTIDEEIATIAGRCFGAVATADIRHIDVRARRRRVRSGILRELSPRVLMLAGAPMTNELRVRAATLDVEGGASASFTTAAWVWRLPGFPLDRIEVTAHRRQHRTSTLAHVHTPMLLADHHLTSVRGLPVTTLPRTIFDLAGVIHPERLRRVANTICAGSPAMVLALHKMLKELATRGRPGIRVMREVLQAMPVGIRLPESGYEARFEELMSNAGITGFRRQVDVGGHSWIGRVDFLDTVTNELIEIDSALHHTSPADIAADAERDAAAIAAGFAGVTRIPTEDLYPRPHLVVAAIRSLRSRDANTPHPAHSGRENGVGGRDAG